MVERARAYVAKMETAISGQGGHAATFAVARKLVQDFALPEPDAWMLLCEYNQRCQPPWTERELRHKMQSAATAHTSNPIQDRPRPALRTVNDGPPPGGGDEPPPPVLEDWRAGLLFKEKRSGAKVILSNVANVAHILSCHEAWKGRIRYDEFSERMMVCDPPWPIRQLANEEHGVWTDEDDTRLESWLLREFDEYEFEPGGTLCRRAAAVVAKENAYHPVREYFAGLKWDGVPRLATWLARFLGAEENEYTATVGTWWLISAVARIYQPGCKADYVLILEGDQGLRKSTALATLAGEWFTDTPIDLNSKDAYTAIQGKMIVELAELESLFKASSSRAKAFFSSAVDRFRKAYAHYDRASRRSCVFAGTVNLDQYLSDPTGDRRYWPVRCTKVLIQELKEARDQIWAEAIARYRAGERWYPETEEEHARCRVEQEERGETDTLAETISAYLNVTKVREVDMSFILGTVLQIEPRDRTPQIQRRVGRIMIRELKWKKFRRREGEVLSWAWRLPDPRWGF